MAQEIANMIDMLPEGEQNLAYEVMRRMVLAWDPDFTKATPADIAAMERGLADYARGEAIRLEDI
jgi:predicted transcriptional regulator